jgi:hypothetical protein
MQTFSGNESDKQSIIAIMEALQKNVVFDQSSTISPIQRSTALKISPDSTGVLDHPSANHRWRYSGTL